MSWKVLRTVFAAVLAVLGLVGCDLLGGGRGSLVIGNIYLYNPVPGGTPFTVVFYDEATSLDPATEYGSAPRAAVLEGVFPGSANDSFDTVNFQAAQVPPGLYTVMAWIDYNGDGVFTPSDPDYEDYSFYSGGWLSSPTTQPPPNVAVPEKGIVDLDILVGQPPL